jgi:hypothetical protein
VHWIKEITIKNVICIIIPEIDMRGIRYFKYNNRGGMTKLLSRSEKKTNIYFSNSCKKKFEALMKGRLDS